MDLLVIKEHDLREKHRLLMTCLTLSALMDFQERNSTHLLKLLSPQSQSHCNKRIIASGRTNRIQLVLNSLPSLVVLSSYFIKSILYCFLLAALPALIGVFHKFGNIFIIALLGIWRKDLIYLRHCKSTVLLCCCTEDNITHNIKSSIQSLRLVIPYITHLKTTAQNSSYIKETAVHGIQTC